MKKTLLIGFTPVQLELARKFLVFRGLAAEIELVSEQQSSGAIDAYVVNGDDASAPSRLALYMRVTPGPVLGIGARAVAGATTHVAGPFKPATADRLKQMLDGTLAATDAPVDNLVAFPAARAATQADVLVVDDSDTLRKTMVRKLNEYGYRVDAASSGDEAMAMLMNNRYKLVFLDVMMPGVDGFEVCRRIKRSAEYKASAVYMLTSKDGMFDKVRGSMAGCDGYLVKPMESRKLREVLDRHLDRPGPAGGDSSLIGSRSSTGELNEAEVRALEGTPPPQAGAATPGGAPQAHPASGLKQAGALRKA